MAQRCGLLSPIARCGRKMSNFGMLGIVQVMKMRLEPVAVDKEDKKTFLTEKYHLFRRFEFFSKTGGKACLSI